MFKKILIVIIGIALIGITFPKSNNTVSNDFKTSETQLKTESNTEVKIESETNIQTKKQSEIHADSEDNQRPEMEVHFIDVGQADCILVESNGHYMLIDAGNNEDSKVIIDYLNCVGITKLDYVIGTHPHEDHIGSLDKVIDTYDIGIIIMPDAVNTTRTFEDVLTAIENKGLQITLPVVGDQYKIGDAEFTIIAPNKDYGNDLNNWSVGIKLTNGDNSFVMCGDAQSVAEQDILANNIDLNADVYKVNHHGSDTATTESFLQAISPEYAVIMCGAENSYGHPRLSILERLKNENVEIFRTDEQGTVIAISDGKKITWNCNP